MELEHHGQDTYPIDATDTSSIDDLQRLLGSLDETKKKARPRKRSAAVKAPPSETSKPMPIVRTKARAKTKAKGRDLSTVRVKVEPDAPAPVCVLPTASASANTVPKRLGGRTKSKPKAAESRTGPSGIWHALMAKQASTDQPLSEANILRVLRGNGGLSPDTITGLVEYVETTQISGAVLSAALASMGADIPEADLEAVLKVLNKLASKDTCPGFSRHFWAGDNLAPFLANVTAWKPSHEKLVIDFALRGTKRPDVYTAVLETLVSKSKLNAPITLGGLASLTAATSALSVAKKSKGGGVA